MLCIKTRMFPIGFPIGFLANRAIPVGFPVGFLANRDILVGFTDGFLGNWDIPIGLKLVSGVIEISQMASQMVSGLVGIPQ